MTLRRALAIWTVGPDADRWASTAFMGGLLTFLLGAVGIGVVAVE